MTVLFNCERICVKVNAGNLGHIINNFQDFYFNYGFDQYIVAKKGNVYISLVVNDGGIFQLVIEEEVLDDELISPIAQVLASTGKIDLYGFHFDSGKSTLQPESDAELSELGDLLADYPNLKLNIIGHTDNVGDKRANQKLSAARAKSVLNALVHSYDANATNLTAEGKGETQPIEDNTSETGRAKNRRVEIVAINPQVITGEDTQVEQPSGEATTSETEQEKPKTDDPSMLDSAKAAADKAEKVKNMGKRFKNLF